MQREEELAMMTMIAAAFSEIWDSCQRQRPLSPALGRAAVLINRLESTTIIS
jgi:hypothetical protein